MKKNLIKAVLLFISTLTIMAGATIAPALPQIQEYFADQPNSELLTKLLLTIPALFIAICAPIAGALIDYLGRIKLLLISLVLYSISGISGFFLDDLPSLLVSRAILGVAVAGVMTTAITLIADYFKGEERSEFMGFQGTAIALGGVVFLLSGGLLAEISWRAPFLVYFCAFGILPFAYYILYEPDVPKEDKANVLIPKVAYPKNQIIIIYITAFVGMMLFYIIPVQIPFYIKHQTGVSNTLIGVAIASSTLSSAVVSFNYKRIKRKFSFSSIYTFSFLFLGIGFLMIYVVSDYILITISLLIAGIGMGVLIPNSNVWIVTLSPEMMRGRVVGGLTTSIFIGQFVSPLFGEPILAYASMESIYAVAGVGMILISVSYMFYHPGSKTDTKL
jgi:MFS family permease